MAERQTQHISPIRLSSASAITPSPLPTRSANREPSLKNGLQYNPADLYAATFDPGIRPGPGQVNAPPYYIDPSSGRPSRINQWNISLQREITRDIVVEAAYVGNRGVWLQGDRMQDWNGLTIAQLAAKGFDVNNAADRAILTSPGTPLPRKRVESPPLTLDTPPAKLWRTLRPYPQFGNITSRWTALGNSWYDALQVKVTKRFLAWLIGHLLVCLAKRTVPGIGCQ